MFGKWDAVLIASFMLLLGVACVADAVTAEGLAQVVRAWKGCQ